MISQNVIMLHEWSYLHISFIYSLICEKSFMILSKTVDDK